MKVVLINGLKGSGKDTFADHLFYQLMIRGHRVAKIPNAEYVKQIATAMYGWNGIKNERGRQLLIDVTEAGYNYDKHFFEKKTLEKARANNVDIIIVPDWRYPVTNAFFRTELGERNVTTIQVTRPETTKDNHKLDTDRSEIGLQDFPFDVVVDNSGKIKDLELHAINTLKYI